MRTFHMRMSRSVVFNRAFFDRVAKAMAWADAFPRPPEGDGSEYNSEEAKQARYKALGVQSGSRFLNIGVDTQVTWPEQETLIQFDQYRLVLMPKPRRTPNRFISTSRQTACPMSRRVRS
jgi:hypothetical protein